MIPFSRKARTHWRRISFSSFWSRLARLAGKVASNWLNTPLMICATCCTRAFDDDVEFQERMAEHIRYMVETIAHHQVDIDSEV
nr:host-nuclease inhibitor Gam family protein [Shigella flexneri]